MKRSLQRRIERLVVGGSLAMLLGIVGVLWFSARGHTRLVEETQRFVSDQGTSDRITRGVLRQLALASSFSTASGMDARQDFLERGRTVHEEIRRYLFGNLTVPERFQLEGMRESHQRFEVVAVQAAELFSRGEEAQARAALESMGSLAAEFLDALESFLSMRSTALDQVQQRQERILRGLVGGGAGLAAAAIGIALLLGWQLSRRVTRPLAELSRATERITAGDMEARAPPGEDDEFRTLSANFNRMTSALQHREAELRRALDDVRLAQDELVLSEKLSAVGRLSAGFAHELNNPLASASGYTQLLAERVERSDTPTPAELRELLAPVLSELARARELVRNFLQVAQRPDGDTGPVPLGATLGVVVALRAYAFQQAGLQLVVGEVPDCHVSGEARTLESVFLHVVNNALDALSPRGSGTLAITGRMLPDEGMVELDFRDDGPGFAEPDRLFEPFYTTKPVGEGTGLGLSLVHRSVTAFGGSVRAENRQSGGARLTIRLPVWDGAVTEDVPPAPSVAAAPAESARPDGAAAGAASAGAAAVNAEPAAPSAGPAARSADPGSSRTPTVLVVEDEVHLRALQSRILARFEVRTFVVESAARAKEVLTDETVDLVISDVRMPGESGVDLYRWVEEHHPHLTARFFFVTGDATAPGLAEIVGNSPDMLIHKPFRLDEYLARLEGILG